MASYGAGVNVWWVLIGRRWNVWSFFIGQGCLLGGFVLGGGEYLVAFDCTGSFVWWVLLGRESTASYILVRCWWFRIVRGVVMRGIWIDRYWCSIGWGGCGNDAGYIWMDR